jgi:two-component system NarL family sensor kinase
LSETPGARLRERLRVERDERRRLAELIHDGPVQSVSALVQMLDAATAASGGGDAARAHDITHRALEVARGAAVELRDIVSGIEPSALRDEGLGAAIEELATRLTARTRVPIDVAVDARDDLGEDARSGLYQIAREALDQAVRRGPPSLVTVQVTRRDNGGVGLSVSDDGATERRQAVLDGLAARASELNGTFAATRDADGLTTVTVELPPSAATL